MSCTAAVKALADWRIGDRQADVEADVEACEAAFDDTLDRRDPRHR